VSALINLSGRIFNTPLLIHPGKAEAILYGIRERLDIDIPKPEASRFMGSSRGADGQAKPYRVQDQVALIDVYGTLVNKGAYAGASSGLTSYEGLRFQLAKAVQDRDVGAICLVIDSPGGEAGGMQAVADAVRAARETKPVHAVVDDMCCSAAYGIASGANAIWTSQTSIVGSIGVVLVHMDHSGELQMAGIRPTIIKAGAKKASGNSLQPLDQEAIEELSGLVSAHYSAFLQTVSAGRGAKLSAKAARETEAAVFVGADAIARGLADRIGTVEQAVEFLAKRAGTSSRTVRAAPARAASASGLSSTLAAPVAARRVSTMALLEDEEIVMNASQLAQLKAEVCADAVARIALILRSPEAKGRMNMALGVALDTALEPTEAVSLLRTAPVETNPASLAARMAEHPTFGGPDLPVVRKNAGTVWGEVHEKTAIQMGVSTKR